MAIRFLVSNLRSSSMSLCTAIVRHFPHNHIGQIEKVEMRLFKVLLIPTMYGRVYGCCGSAAEKADAMPVSRERRPPNRGQTSLRRKLVFLRDDIKLALIDRSDTSRCACAAITAVRRVCNGTLIEKERSGAQARRLTQIHRAASNGARHIDAPLTP